MPGSIHYDHPFLDPEDQRHPIRRFRGRLSAPVTIITAGDETDRTGLTVSSLMVAEGDPPRIHFLLGDQAYLWDRIRDHGRFVVHILEEGQRHLADRFAGIMPSPGGPFSGVSTETSDYGPVIDEAPSRAYCSFEQARPGHGAYLMIDGIIESVEVHDLAKPLQWFRGAYRGLA